MAIAITDQASTIKFDLGNGEEYHLDKDGISIKKRFGYVYVYGSLDDNTSKYTKLKMKYTDVTSPAVASNDLLIAAILGYKASAGFTVGDVRLTDGVEVADIKANALSGNNEILVNLEGHACSNNSSTANLGAGATFTGAWRDNIDYGAILVSVKADQDSATDGLVIDWSSDGVSVHDSDVFSIFANNGKAFSLQPVRRYFRVKYTNGGTIQTSFDLETTLRRYPFKPSSHRINDNIVGEDDAELTKAVITGISPAGTFDNVQITRNGNFKVSIDEYGDTPAIDAFGRLRISEPYTLYDSKQLHDKQPLFWDESIGNAATSTHNSVNASVEMAVTASASDFVIRQTKQRFNYQPGKSQLALLTFYAPQNGNSTKRIGLFDGTGVNYLTPNNGIFFEVDGSVSWNIAKNGSITETVAQASWNVDTLDGNGVSGKTLDLTAAQILIIDYEWLGVGRVRVGFVIDGLPYYVHYFNHANESSFDSVYMSTPNLPIRYEIVGNGSGVAQLDHICSTVMSEGGLEETGVLRSINTGTVHIDASAANTSYAILGIRLKAAYKDVTVLPEFFSMIDETGVAFKWELCLNPTIAGAFTYGDVTNSALQSAKGATANTVSNTGLIIDSGFIPAGGVQAGSGSGNKITTALRLGSTIAGVQDEIVLVATPLDINADIQASLTFRELL